MRSRSLIALIVFAFALFIAGPVWATDDCENGDCETVDYKSELDIGSNAGESAYDYKENVGDNYGSAGQFSGEANAFSQMEAYGPNVEGHVYSTGGVLGYTETFDLDVDGGDGVGAYSETYGLAEAGMKSPEGLEGVFYGGFGLEMDIENSAGSYYGGTSTDPDTFGLATQEFCAVGGFEMEGNYADYTDGLEASGAVEFLSDAYSHSYGYTHQEDGVTTIGKGSLVESTMEMESTMDTPEGQVDGMWSASGGAVTETRQSDDLGYANAVAIGEHSASGSLGQNYSGEASGYSNTSMTSFDDMVGGINRAEAGMSVQSQID